MSEITDLDRRAKAANRPSVTPDERLSTFAREERDRAAQKAAGLLERAEVQGRTLNPAEVRELQDSAAATGLWDERHSRHEERVKAHSLRFRTVREELTYRPGSATSWFKDQWTSRMGDDAAAKRLARHADEMRVELAARQARVNNETRSRGDVYEARVNPNRSPGFGGSFAPPLWLVDRYAVAPRPARVLSNLVKRYPLPQGVQSVNVPRIISPGTVTGTVRDDSAPPARDFTDAVTSSAVVTIAGFADISIQAVEQSPAGAHLDEIIFTDLATSLDAQLEAQVIAGTGINGQLTGVTTLPGINSITYTDASPSGVEFYKPLGEAVGAIGNTRKLPAEAIIGRSGRWAWLATAEDKEERPLQVPLDFDSTDSTNPPGQVLGLPFHTTEAIPTNLGEEHNQDVVIVCRPADDLLFEGEPHAAELAEVLSGTLGIRLRLHQYFAFVPGRWPEGVSTITGTGMVPPTNF